MAAAGVDVFAQEVRQRMTDRLHPLAKGLAAVAREAGVAGFGQMMRVLVAETAEADPEWLQEYGIPGTWPTTTRLISAQALLRSSPMQAKLPRGRGRSRASWRWRGWRKRPRVTSRA